MANRFVPAKSHGGGFRAGQPTLIVIHSLEAPARRGLAYELATGWIQNAGVSPHSMTDPGETVDLLNLSTVGWHCGNGNQVSIGLEVTGYAAWSFDTWTSAEAFAAVRLDAKRAAEAAAALGIPLRWLSLQQIRNGERGFCTHADISATLGGTNHTDPGPGFPYAIFLQMVQQWTAGATVDPTATPNPQPAGGPGGADPRDWSDMATKEEIQALIPTADQIAAAVWARVLNTPGFAVTTPGIDDRAGDLLAEAVRRTKSLPTDDSAAGAVWSRHLDPHRAGLEGENQSRAGDLLAEIDAHTAPKD